MSPDKLEQESHLAAGLLMASYLLSGPSRCLLSECAQAISLVGLGQDAALRNGTAAAPEVLAAELLCLVCTCSSHSAAGTSTYF